MRWTTWTTTPMSSATSLASITTSPACRYPASSDAILTVTALDHIHYGSDYAFTSEFVVDLVKGQLETGLAERDLVIADLAENTRRLFPTLGDES